MQEPFDFQNYARQVHEVSRVLMGCPGGDAEIAGRMHLLTVAAERDLARFGDVLERSRIVCAPGCGACCVLNVAVLFPEAVAITRFLRRRLCDEELDTLRGRLQTLLWRTRWLDDEERLFLHEPCAFLDPAGLCAIHPVRPLLCRAITSTDAGACREAIAMVALSGAPSVEMNLFQKKLLETIYCQLGEALASLGLDHRPMRLSAAVLGLLDDPQWIELFVAGEKVPVH